jgi:glycosyltransferase involved in cell wall biosynthesis
LVSCIVPVFNGDRYLESIFAQSGQPSEVIVVDDGSTDGTAQAVARYKDRVQYFKQSNGGPAATRNLGLSQARNGFVAFLDQDNLWHPEKLDRQLARFQARPKMDAPRTPSSSGSGDGVRGLTSANSQARTGRARLYDRCATYETSYVRSYWIVCISLWLGDTTDLFVGASECGNVIELMPHVLLYRRMHASNLTRRRSEASKEEFLQLSKVPLLDAG